MKKIKVRKYEFDHNNNKWRFVREISILESQYVDALNTQRIMYLYKYETDGQEAIYTLKSSLFD